MAQSRLEKIGTIFSRVTGLLRAGAMKSEDKPLWYTIYAAFPPKLEPRFDRPAPNMSIRPIFYQEDTVRAKYQKSLRQPESMSLSDFRRQTQTQQFIGIYRGLQEQGALDDEQIFTTAQELLAEKRLQGHTGSEANEYATEQDRKLDSCAEEKSKGDKGETSPATGRGVNIQNLFKD